MGAAGSDSGVSTVGCNASDPAQYWAFASNGSIMQRGLCMSLHPVAAAPPPPQKKKRSLPLTQQHSRFKGFVQLAEASGNGCNKDPRGSAAGQCCIPVPGVKVSGCHHQDVSPALAAALLAICFVSRSGGLTCCQTMQEPKWDFN